MKSGTSPILAILIGGLLMGGMGQGGTGSTDSPAAKAISSAVSTMSSEEKSSIADSISGLILSLRPAAERAAKELVTSARGEASKSAGAAKPAPAAEPKPLPRHIRMAPPPPTPVRTPEERAKIDAQRAMYERIMREREEERAAEELLERQAKQDSAQSQSDAAAN